MKKLNIATKKCILHLEDVPDEYKFIENISQRYADNKSDLEAYYHAGVDALEDYRKSFPADLFERFHIWVVQQAVFRKMQERNAHTSESIEGLANH